MELNGSKQGELPMIPAVDAVGMRATKRLFRTPPDSWIFLLSSCQSISSGNCIVDSLDICFAFSFIHKSNWNSPLLKGEPSYELYDALASFASSADRSRA